MGNPSIHHSGAGRASRQTEYAGRRHARLTRSMKDIPRAILPVLVELRYQIADGETRQISNRALASLTGLGEGFVSAAVRWLAGEAVSYYAATRRAPRQPFIVREALGPGKGHALTMLPPPELRAAPAPRVVDPPAIVGPPAAQLSLFGDDDFVGDHTDDPMPEGPERASQCTALPLQGDHPTDPPILCTHADQQQQRERVPVERAHEQAVMLPGALFPIPWSQIQAANPGYTIAALHADFAKLQTRPDLPTDIQRVKVLVAARLSGQAVYSQAEIAVRAQDVPGAPRRPQRSATSPGGPVLPTAAPCPDEAARLRQLEDTARAMAPGADEVTVLRLVDALARGVDVAPILRAWKEAGGGT
jgi:hypothetical protein